MLFFVAYSFSHIAWAQFPIDSSFGSKGRVYYALPNADYTQLLDMQITPEGKIITCMIRYSGSNQDPWLVQFNSDGTVDSGFAFNGALPLGIYGSAYNIKAKILVDPLGYIYTFGSSKPYQNSGIGWLHKYSKLGERDTSFNPIETHLKMPSNFTSSCMYLELLKTGHYYLSSGYDYKIWKFKPNHTPDSSWGGDGIVDTVCPCITGVFEHASGEVDIAGTDNYGSQSAIWIFDTHGNKDLKRTVKGWLVAPTGTVSPLKNETFCINSVQSDSKFQFTLKTLAYKDAFVARPNFGQNGRNTVTIDSACWGEAISTIETLDGFLISTWNRYEFDDNSNYVKFRAGINPMDESGNLFPQFNNHKRRYLLPNEINNYGIAALRQNSDSSYIAGMNIWNTGSYAALIVKFKPISVGMPDLHNAPNAIVDVAVYPNPAHGTIHIRPAQKENIHTVGLYDLSGKVALITKFDPSDSDFSVDVSRLKAGFYVLKITTDSEKHSYQNIQINY